MIVPSEGSGPELEASRAQAFQFAPGLSGQTVLVTGARGFLGSKLRFLLSEVSAEVVGTTRGPSEDQRGRWVTCDYSDRAQVARMLGAIKPAVIFHLAGFASSQGGIGGARAALDGNAISLHNLLLGVADTCPTARVLTAGTLESSDPTRAPAEFGTSYGGSKAVAELLVRILRDFGGLRVASARIGMTYGPGDPNERRLVPHLIASLRRGSSPPLSAGNRLEDWIFVDDVIAALVAAVVKNLPLSTFDVGTGVLVPVRQVVETVARIVGGPATPRLGELPERPGSQYPADIARTGRALGWQPKVSLEAGLRHTVATMSSTP